MSALEAAGPTPATFFFALGGAGLLADLARASWRLSTPRVGRWEPASLFVVAWFAAEFVGHLALSPFPAVRRVLGLSVAATLVLGRLASQATRPRATRGVWSAVAVSVALGGLVYTVDFCEALAERSAVRDAGAWLAATAGAGQARVFFAGHWGFQYYAESAGMTPAVAGRFPTATRVARDDFIVLPSARVDQQQIRVDAGATEVVHQLELNDPLPWATLPGFYVGDTPFGRLLGPRVSVTIYRATRDFMP